MLALILILKSLIHIYGFTYSKLSDHQSIFVLSSQLRRSIGSTKIIDVDYKTTRQGDLSVSYEQKCIEKQEIREVECGANCTYEEQDTHIYNQERNTIQEQRTKEEEEQRQWEEEQRAYQEHIRSHQFDHISSEREQKVVEIQQNFEPRNLQSNEEHIHLNFQEQNTIQAKKPKVEKGEERRKWEEKQRVYQIQVDKSLHEKEQPIRNMRQNVEQRHAMYGKEISGKDEKIAFIKDHLKRSQQEKETNQTNEIGVNKRKSNYDHIRKDSMATFLMNKLNESEQGKENEDGFHKIENSYQYKQNIRKTKRHIHLMKQDTKKKGRNYEKELSNKDEQITKLKEKISEITRKREVNQYYSKERKLSENMNQIVRETQRQTAEMKQNMDKKRGLYQKELLKKDEQIEFLKEKLEETDQQREKELYTFEKEQLDHDISQIISENQHQMDEMRQSMEKRSIVYKKSIFMKDDQISSLKERLKETEGQWEEKQRALEEYICNINEIARERERETIELRKKIEERCDLYEKELASKDERIMNLESRLQENIKQQRKEDCSGIEISNNCLSSKETLPETRKNRLEMKESKNDKLASLENRVEEVERLYKEEEQRAFEEHQRAHHMSQAIHNTQYQIEVMKKLMEERHCMFEKELSRRDKHIAALEEKLCKERTEAGSSITDSIDKRIEKLVCENMKLQAAVDSVQNWETAMVTWEIPNFGWNSTTLGTVYESQNFTIGGIIMNLELHVIDKSLVEGECEEADGDISLFFSHFLDDEYTSFVYPKIMEGSKINMIISNNHDVFHNNNFEFDSVDSKFCIVGKDQDFYDSRKGRIGWTQITTLNELHHIYVDNVDREEDEEEQGCSIRIEANVQLKKNWRRWNVSLEI